MKEKTCCFTGHRDIPADKADYLRDEVQKAIEYKAATANKMNADRQTPILAIIPEKPIPPLYCLPERLPCVFIALFCSCPDRKDCFRSFKAPLLPIKTESFT